MSVSLIRYFHLQAGVSFEDAGRIASLFRREEHSANSMLLREGDTCKHLYFVETGCIRSFYITDSGQEKTRHIAFDHSVGTALSAFVSGSASGEYIDTLENTLLYSISRQDFYRLVKDIKDMALYYRHLLETAYLAQNDRIRQSMTLSAGERYARLLSEKPAYARRLSNRILASYLDMNQETLSRIKSKTFLT